MIRIADIKYYVANQAAVLMGIYELAGEGFNFAEYKAFVEDIFVAFPY